MARRLLLVPLAALVLAGCGGGGRAPLSRADFVKRANASCLDYNARISALKAPADVSEVPAYIDRATRRLEDHRARLAGLEPPKAAKADYDRLLAVVDQTRAVAAELKAAARKGDAGAIAAASSRGRTLDGRERALAKRLGLTQCATS
jgi:hypothetical protein